MASGNHREAQPGMLGIARQASLYDWLVGLTRTSRRPQPVPPRLYADLGLDPPHERPWPR